MKCPRLYELYTSTKNRSSEVENMIRTGEAQLDDWEQTLQELQPNAWVDFLKKSENCNFTYHRIAGLKGLSALLNEAKGYIFLKKVVAVRLSLFLRTRLKHQTLRVIVAMGR